MNAVLSIPGSVGSFAQLLTMLIIFVAVLALTYVTTRWIAGIQNGTAGSRRNIRVIETLKLTTNKYIQIVKAGEKYLVIGVAKDTITMLTELSEEEIQFAGEQSPMKFRDIWEKAKEMKQKK